jgi:hypothetical protein
MTTRDDKNINDAIADYNEARKLRMYANNQVEAMREIYGRFRPDDDRCWPLQAALVCLKKMEEAVETTKETLDAAVAVKDAREKLEHAKRVYVNAVLDEIVA